MANSYKLLGLAALIISQSLMADSIAELNELQNSPVEFQSANSCDQAVEAFERIQRIYKLGARFAGGNNYEVAQAAMDKCIAERFKSCYPSLRPEISWKELTELFNESIQNKTGRMNYPSDSCYSRAYLFSKRLTEAGYSSQQLWIGYSPTLIEINRAGDNKLASFSTHTGRPRWTNDFEGMHAVATVNVRMPNGELRQVILDPQFFNEPVTLEDYFINTAGQNCKNATGQNVNLELTWNCTYKVKEAFETLDGGSWLNRNRSKPEIDRCGWNFTDEYQREVRDKNRHNPPPTPFPANLDDKTLRQKLILQGYERRKKTLEERLIALRKYSSNSKPQIDEILKALEEYPEVKKRIRANIKSGKFHPL